jgi:hypothetical protein
MVGQLYQLVNVVPYPVDMVGNAQGIGQSFPFFRFAVQDHSSKQWANDPSLGYVQIVAFANGPQFFIFGIVEPEHYIMVSLPVSQSFPALFPGFILDAHFSRTLRQK